jgi:hypothetical protein
LLCYFFCFWFCITRCFSTTFCCCSFSCCCYSFCFCCCCCFCLYISTSTFLFWFLYSCRCLTLRTNIFSGFIINWFSFTTTNCFYSATFRFTFFPFSTNSSIRTVLRICAPDIKSASYASQIDINSQNVFIFYNKSFEDIYTIKHLPAFWAERWTLIKLV